MTIHTEDSLNKLTSAELIQLASVELNLSLPSTFKKAELIHEIMSTQAVLAPAPPKTQAKEAWKQDRVRVKFHETHDPQGSFPVKGGLNDYYYCIKRNAEVDIPRKVLQALNNCVEKRAEPVAGDIGVYRYRDVARFPYTVIADPAPKA